LARAYGHSVSQKASVITKHEKEQKFHATTYFAVEYKLGIMAYNIVCTCG